MKRPSEYMTMTDGVTQHDYKRELNKYIDYLESENKQLNLDFVRDSLIAWEQYKKANWYESEAIDVEKLLMEQFKAIYNR